MLKDEPKARPKSNAARATEPSREVALMGMLGWVMMGLAIWHFTIFLPDRFWGGIVGAFVGSLVGVDRGRPDHLRGEGLRAADPGRKGDRHRASCSTSFPAP